jgi:ribosomal protein S18 acetylase RimI-like enzyme
MQEVLQYSPRIAQLLQYCLYQPTAEKCQQYCMAIISSDSRSLYVNSTLEQGIIAVEQHGDTLEILAIAVDTSLRYQQISRRMIEDVLQLKQCSTIYAETDNGAVIFYRKCGFTIECLGEKYPGRVRYTYILKKEPSTSI